MHVHAAMSAMKTAGIGVASALLVALAACTSSLGARPPHAIPECLPAETLVCYGKTATRLERSSTHPRFCECRRVLNRLD